MNPTGFAPPRHRDLSHTRVASPHLIDDGVSGDARVVHPAVRTRLRRVARAVAAAHVAEDVTLVKRCLAVLRYHGDRLVDGGALWDPAVVVRLRAYRGGKRTREAGNTLPPTQQPASCCRVVLWCCPIGFVWRLLLHHPNHSQSSWGNANAAQNKPCFTRSSSPSYPS